MLKLNREEEKGKITKHAHMGLHLREKEYWRQLANADNRSADILAMCLVSNAVLEGWSQTENQTTYGTACVLR